MSLTDNIKKFEKGIDGQLIEPTLVLSSRGGNKIGVINNVVGINQTHTLSDVDELSFDVYKEVDGKVNEQWDKLKDFKFIQIPRDNTWYEATITIDEEDDTIKHVTCVHANESELGQLNLYETEINTEGDIARDDYEETFFYNQENPNASLLHRILKDKAPHYQIYHVDETLAGLFRQFSFDGCSIHDALNQIAEECNCLFRYGEWNENDGKYHRTISAYDLEDYCCDCKKRGNYNNGVCTNCGSTNIINGYGEDTGIFVCKENLATSISYETNTDEVKNCFRLSGGDDIMTAAIKSCNPNMSQYIWYFSDDMLEDMSDELETKITQYTNLVKSYRDTREISISSSLVSKYNNLVQTYKKYNDELSEISYPIIGTVGLTDAYYKAVNLYGYLKSELMPASEDVKTTTAAKQMAILKRGSNMKNVAISSTKGTIAYTTANSAIQSYAKVYIDTSRYKVIVFTDEINGAVWNGTITLTSYTDDEDTETSDFTITLFDSSNNEKYVSWVEQSIQKAMANREATDISVVDLFNKDESLSDFKNRIKLYSLDYLSIINAMANSAITIMVEQGIAKQSKKTADVYTQLYKPYLNKNRAVEAEIAEREKQLSYLLRPTDDEGNTNPKYPSLGLIDAIIKKQTNISNLLDLQTYLGDELWEELSFYRREDEYQNENYISDGLTDAEIIEYAKRFFDDANKEIIKSATLQHTISAPLVNFLLMDEFSNLQYKFNVGNWIRLKVDDKIYKLRLTSWSVDYDNIEDLDVEFSDCVYIGNVVSDVESILSKSRSMSTTYNYTARQANKGKDALDTIKIYRDSGIDFNRIKAIVSKGNTNIVYDDDGILLKRVDGTETLPEQARIYNNGIYVTRDAWETVSTGLGHYSYIDPETGETVETYGIIADTVIGRLILGEDLKIYSQSGKFEMGDNGLLVTAKPDSDNTDLFAIQKDSGDGTISKYIYVDSDGNVQINGSSVYIGGFDNGRPVSYVLDDARKVASNYLSADQSGIMIADLRNGQKMPSDPDLNGRNVLISSTGVDIRNGTTSLAEFSSGVRVGANSSGHMTLDATGIKAYKNASTKYFEVGDGSTLAYQTYIVQETSLSVILSHPIVDITSVVINGNTIDSENYTWIDDNLTIIDRPKEAINSMSVTYIYYISSSDDDSDYDTATITETITEKYDAISLTITCQYDVSYISSINISPSSSSGNKITYNVSPPSGTEINIVYRLSDSSPYFTFDNKNGKVSFSSGGAATGISSFITGIGGTASGLGAFVAGRNNIASGGISTALGNKNTSKGYSSFSGGEENIASGEASFAIGYKNNATNSATFVSGRENKSTGAYSASLGWESSAGGQSSFACGRLDKAVGDSSTALGYSTKAGGFASFSCGRKTKANAEGSSAMGYETIVNSKGGLACGRYNTNSSTYLFSVGNGSSTNRSNALTIKDNGSCCIAGSMYSGTNFGSGNYRKMFKSASKNGTTTVGAKTTKQFSISIGETGYTPWAIGGLHSSSASCNIFRFEISGNDFIVSLYNPNSEDINVTVYVNIKYIATDAL